MSDDLISRKEAVELVIAEYDRFQANGGSHSGRYELDKTIKILKNMPTAYDKEKVLGELEKRRAWYDINENPKNPLDISECADVREHKGKWIAYDEAIAIVEKGGLN